MVEELRARTGEQGLSGYLVVDSSGKCDSRFPPPGPLHHLLSRPKLAYHALHAYLLTYSTVHSYLPPYLVSCSNTEGAKNNKTKKLPPSSVPYLVLHLAVSGYLRRVPLIHLVEKTV